MKKQNSLLAFALLLQVNSFAQTTEIVDPKFEQASIDKGYDSNGLTGDILNSDAEAVTVLNLSGKDIKNSEHLTLLMILTEKHFGSPSILLSMHTGLSESWTN